MAVDWIRRKGGRISVLAPTFGAIGRFAASIRSLFRCRAIFFPGGTPQARYLEQYGVGQQRMTIAQMTVDVCAIRRFCSQNWQAARSAARARWRMPAHDRIVLYVGRLEASKGLQELLSAFAHAVAEDNNLCLAIAGDGSFRARVEAIAAKPDCRVSYLGRLSGDDVLRAYLAADLLVLPSLFEPWGLVINGLDGLRPAGDSVRPSRLRRRSRSAGRDRTYRRRGPRDRFGLGNTAARPR